MMRENARCPDARHDALPTLHGQGRAGVGWGCLGFSEQPHAAMTTDRENHMAVVREALAARCARTPP